MDFVLAPWRQLQEVESSFDALSVLEWGRSHAEVPVFATAIYLALVFQMPARMADRKPFNVRIPFLLWNLLLTVFSCIGASRTVPALLSTVQEEGFFGSVCGEPFTRYHASPAAFWIALFVWSKVAESLDTIFLLLQKKPVIFLHWYHHTSVGLYTYHATIFLVGPGMWFAAMNFSVHSLMYFYYFLMTFRYAPVRRICKWFAPLVTLAQLSQMVVGCVVMSHAAYWTYTLGEDVCHVDPSNYKLGLAMYFSYLCLFTKLFWDLYFSGSSTLIPALKSRLEEYIGPIPANGAKAPANPAAAPQLRAERRSTPAPSIDDMKKGA